MSDKTSAANQENEALRLDYTETLAIWRHLVDVRFKLLTLVPASTAVGVSLSAGTTDPAEKTMISVFAILSLIGVVLYDLRNSMFHDVAIHRAMHIEHRLGLSRTTMDAIRDEDLPRKFRLTTPPLPTGGYFEDRPREKLAVLPMVRAGHDTALAWIYSVSLGAWATLAAIGVADLRNWSIGESSRQFGVLVGIGFGGFVLACLQVYDARWGNFRRLLGYDATASGHSAQVERPEASAIASD